MDVFRRWDPLVLIGAMAVLFLSISDDPWWSLTGATTSNLMTVQVSPYYIHTDATGLVATLPFAEFLGPLTRVFLVIAVTALIASGVRPLAWWRQLTTYFGLCALIELYLSFLLNYHAIQALFLGGYGIIPPYSGTSNLQATITGLDFQSFEQPLVAAGFSLQFYIGLLSIGLVCGSMILNHRMGKTKIEVPKGLEAIFTSESE